MASSFNIYKVRLLQWSLFCIVLGTTFAQLSENFYSTSCPQALKIIEDNVQTVITEKPYIGAALLQIHLLDCFLGGCDGSAMLNETSTLIQGNAKIFIKQTGYEVIDGIKAQLEKECPGVVSCADVLAVVARDSIAMFGGPRWIVPLGRKDSDQALKVPLDGVIDGLLANLDAKIATFNKMGFTKDEYVALLGGHTVGKARCVFYKKRIHEKADIDPEYAKGLRKHCLIDGGDNITAPIDSTTPFVFDNEYFTNLVNKRGLLEADQELYTGKGGTTDSIVKSFSANKKLFFEVFSKAFVKLGKLQIVSGTNGEIRYNCRVRNNVQ